MNKRELAEVIREWIRTPAGERYRLADAVDRQYLEAVQNLWAGYRKASYAGGEGDLQRYHRENKARLKDFGGKEEPCIAYIKEWLSLPAEKRKHLETLIEKTLPAGKGHKRMKVQEAFKFWLADCLQDRSREGESSEELLMKVAEWLEKAEKERPGVIAEFQSVLGTPSGWSEYVANHPGLPSDDEIRKDVKAILGKLEK